MCLGLNDRFAHDLQRKADRPMIFLMMMKKEMRDAIRPGPGRHEARKRTGDVR